MRGSSLTVFHISARKRHLQRQQQHGCYRHADGRQNTFMAGADYTSAV
jgi:hypothetical protein